MYPQPQHTEPEYFVICPCCKAILGYAAQVGELKFLYLFSYPPRGVRTGLVDRRVNSRMLAGDVLCPHCGTWQTWTSAPASATSS